MQLYQRPLITCCKLLLTDCTPFLYSFLFLLLCHHKGQTCSLTLAPPTVSLLDAKENNAKDKPFTQQHFKGIVKALYCSLLTANNGTNNWFIPEWQRQYWCIILSRRSVGSRNLGTSSQAGLELMSANVSGTKGSVSQSMQIAWHIGAVQPLPATNRVGVVLLMLFFFSFVCFLRCQPCVAAMLVAG